MAIYLDYAATTPLLPEVKQSLSPWLEQYYGNPSSLHQHGRMVRDQIDQARRTVAQALGAKANQIIFTSGGTEADNLALLGLAASGKKKGRNHIVTTAIEHHAVLDTCHYLEQNGFYVTYLPVDTRGRVRIEDVKKAITPDTACISVMFGNNEIGTTQPIHEIGAWAQQKEIPFHTDAVQALGAVALDTSQLPVDLLSISAHKIGGLKGVGALYIKEDIMIQPQMYGGTQERRRRPGTENVLGIQSLAIAIEHAVQTQPVYVKKMQGLREAFLRKLDHFGVYYVYNGHPSDHLPHILNLSFVDVDTEVMLMNLDLAGISCASGSACTSGTLEVSHVLQAMQLEESIQRSAVRFSFGWGVELEDLDKTAEQIATIIMRLQTYSAK